MKRTPVIVPTLDPDDYRRAAKLYAGFLRADLVALLAKADLEIARLMAEVKRHKRAAGRNKAERKFAESRIAIWQERTAQARKDLELFERSTVKPSRVSYTCLNCSGRF